MESGLVILRLGLLCLQWVLYAFLSNNLEELYGYTRIGYSSPSFYSLAASLAALAVLASLLRSETRRPSDAGLWLLASFVVVPTLVVASVNPFFSSEIRRTASIVVLLGFIVPAAIVKELRPPTAVAASGLLSPRLFHGVVLALSGVAMATFLVGYGVSSLSLSFGDEYVRRLAARGLPSPYPGANYLTSWFLTVTIPLLFVLALQGRILGFAILGFVGSLLIFSFDGQKSAFVPPTIAVMLVFSLRRREQSFPWFGSLLTFGPLAGSMLAGRVWPALQLDVLVARRIGLVPGLLTHSYVEFAQSHGYTMYAQSWLKPFSAGAQQESLGIRVGQHLDPHGALNANAHLWADGFGSAGLAGVVIAGGMLAIVLRLMDRLAASRDPVVAGAVLGTACLVFVNGSFHSSLLTGGVIFALLLIWAMPIDLSARRGHLDAPRPIGSQSSAGRPASLDAGCS